MVALLLVAIGPLVLRLVGHTSYLHDPESLMLPTVGRELSHGHWGDLVLYRYNAYQGGVVIDGLLAAIGFKVFGDHVLAWHWAHLAYAAGIALFGMAVLRRTSTAAGAVAFALFFATMPFVLKDGLITPAGHHASSVFYALLALWIAVGRRSRGGVELRPGFGRGLAAGVVVAVGAWYGRSVVSIGPAVALALLPGGLRSLLGLGIGCLVLPALGAADAWWLSREFQPYAAWGFEETFRTAMWKPHASSIDPDRMSKLWEALSVAVEPMLFGQPFDPDRRFVESAHLIGSEIWSGAWSKVPVLLAAALAVLGGLWARHVRRDRIGSAEPPGVAEGADPAAPPWRRLTWGTAVVSAVVAGYIGSYVFSPFRIDPGTVQLAQAGNAVGIPGPRYLLPGFLVLTLGLGQVAGLLWGSRWWRRALAVVFVFSIADPGFGAAKVDWTTERDRPSHLSIVRPFHYSGMFGPNRGPDEEVHLSCPATDPVSRANHLRAVGAFRAPVPGGIVEDPRLIQESLVQLRHEHPLSDADALFVLQGMGARLADHLTSTKGLSRRALLQMALAAADELDSRGGAAYLDGFGRGLSLVGEHSFDIVCREDQPGPRLLCRRLGGDGAHAGFRRLPLDPGELLPGYDADSVVATDLMHGAGEALADVAPWTDRPPHVLAAWPPALAEAFEEGWTAHMARRDWRVGDAWVPELVP